MRFRKPGGRVCLGVALVGTVVSATASTRAEDLTRRIVVELYRYHEPDIRRCWTSSSPARPTELLKVQLRVKSDGSVSIKDVEETSENLRACLDAAAAGWKLKARPVKGAINLPAVSFSVVPRDLRLPTVHDLENIPADLAGSQWWAVCRGDSGFELRAARIKVRRIPRDDPNPDERTHRLSILGCPKPVFAVRNLPGAGPRKLTVATDPARPPDQQPAWTMATPPVIISPEWARELALGGQRYRVEVPSDPKEVRVSLRSATSSQTILTVKTEFTPAEYFDSDAGLHVLWAGDLDGDGKLDLVLWEDYAHDSIFRLYLSTAARPGDLVGEAGLLFE